MKLLRRAAGWLGLTLAVAAIVHLATLHALPRFVMSRALARMGPPNSIHFGRRPTAASRGVVRPSPDILYAVCPFDLSNGPLLVAARIPHSTYFSISAFDSATNNFFVLNDRQVPGDSVEFLITDRSAKPPRTPSARAIVRSPTRRGLVLFRIVIDDERNLPALAAMMHQDRCETASLD
jgi:uncharacterized membrane protein